MRTQTDLVHVIHGANDDRLPVVGASVGTVKLSLQDAFNIPYFSEAFVNGQRVSLDHVLAVGDHLEFVREFGVKSSKIKSKEELEAKGLLRNYPELVAMAANVKGRDLPTDRSIDEFAEMVARWCKDRFGPLPSDAIATVDHVCSLLAKLRVRAESVAHGKQPKKAGRPPIRRELADFAKAHESLTKKEIAARWNQEHPDDKVKDEDVREAIRRFYGDKAGSSKIKRAK